MSGSLERGKVKVRFGALLVAALVFAGAPLAALGGVSRSETHNGCALVPRSLIMTALGDQYGVFSDRSTPFSPLAPGLPGPAMPAPQMWLNCFAHASHGGWSLSMLVGRWPSASDALAAFTVFRRGLYHVSGDARAVSPCRTVAGIGGASCRVPVVQPLIGGKNESIGTLLFGVRGRLGVEVLLYNGGDTARQGTNGKPRNLHPEELAPIAKTILSRVPQG